MVKYKKLSGSREVADLARETSSSGLSRGEDSPPQVPSTAISCSGSPSERRISAGLDSLLMVNVNPSFFLSRLALPSQGVWHGSPYSTF
ncbi:hypothetical protein E2C01_092913 [Portunus trituberculatus]|uniref:Uncharacterized protein n=1 Tax=Portunus trituberculatus TaxID=210409 RepID=A0A5B7JT64_PORTR|nr:hypothetical protein [Portunus trituberculatus]